jgi:predicted DNA-binding transcriptional regulator AlpA
VPKPKPAIEPLYYTTEDLATLLNESVSTIQHWRKKGVCTGPYGIRIGRNVRYPRAKIHALLERLALDQGAS